MKAIAFPNPAEIYQLPGPVLGEPIVYAAVEVRDGVRELMAVRLLEALAGLAPEWTGALEWGPVSLHAGPLGRPLLRLGTKPGPSLSFSETGNLLWGAVVGQGQVGLDAARVDDLASPYPYSRAFHPAEWDWAWQHCQGRTAAAAALLWAAKEAAVKALGVGFHTHDPLDLEVALVSPAWEGLQLRVRVPEEMKAWARPWDHGWIALAAA
jgi:phosphopantetheinyl transferase